MILVSTIGFSGMPDLVMWPENTLDIELWVKNPKMATNSRNLESDRCYIFRDNHKNLDYILLN